jgi:hypothetical protein
VSDARAPECTEVPAQHGLIVVVEAMIVPN